MRIRKVIWGIARVTVVLGVMGMLQGCPGGYGYKYNTGTFPSNPVNFAEMNTEYDDYNATSPILGEAVPLCFSSNRNSKGENFDLVYKPFSIVFSKTTGELNIGAEDEAYGEWLQNNSTLTDAMGKVNSPYDELGPFLLFRDLMVTEDYDRYYTYFLLYANNENGDLDIHYTHNTNTENWEEPAPVNFLNSEANDAYPTFDARDSAIWFCSDREGNFDIYKAIFDPDKEVPDILNVHSAVIEKDSILSSAGADDKCPYIAYNNSLYHGSDISNNLLVFASNREGGYGGFDLYFSKLENGKWGEPQNFGAGINTEYDEYRPIVRPQYDFTNDFMLFSSNRPGGMGGFDLYYVGIPSIGYPN